MFTFKVLKLFREKKFCFSVTTTPPRRKPRPTFKPRLEPLEERWCPDTTNDVLYWNPQGGSQDASKAANWWDQTKLMQGLTAPGPTNGISLGMKANAPIEIPSGQLTAASITVQGNYNNTLTLDANATLLVGGGSIQPGSILTVVSSSNVGVKLDGGANFTVAAGATLNLKDPVNSQFGKTYLTGDGKQGEYLDNQGTVNWNGIAMPAGNAAISDKIYVPVYNTGTFNANGGSGGDTTMVGGNLTIVNSDPITGDVGFMQTSGGLNLTNNAQVTCIKGYYQSGGNLTSDATPCILNSGATGNGDIDIDGGVVTVDNVANSVSTLTFVASTVEIWGEIDVNGLTQNGGKSTRSDQLICKGAAVTLEQSSYLLVGTTGGFPLGAGNRWSVITYASESGSWGRPPSVPAGMSVSTGATDVLVSN